MPSSLQHRIEAQLGAGDVDAVDDQVGELAAARRESRPGSPARRARPRARAGRRSRALAITAPRAWWCRARCRPPGPRRRPGRAPARRRACRSCRRRRSRTPSARRGPAAGPGPARRRRRARPARPRRAGRPASGRRCRSRTGSPCRARRTWPVTRSTRSTASSCSGVSVSETSDAMRSPTATSVRVGQRRADLEHPADEHPAAAGHRVVLLAALAHRGQDVRRRSRPGRRRRPRRSA